MKGGTTAKRHVMAFDLGTTGAKTCVYRFDGEGAVLVASAGAEYPLAFLPDGGVEQDCESWWRAVASTARAVRESAGLEASEVAGLAFCCQMQGLVLVDEEGRALRPAFSYLDHRAQEERDELMDRGFKIAGMNALRLLPSLLIAGGVSASAKDPVWKYRWLRKHEPEIFARVAKWLDVKDYLVLRATGRAVMTRDSAHVTFLYDTRPGAEGWSPTLCGLFGVEARHLPEVIGGEEVAGGLSAGAAAELGLAPGTPVFGGGGDLSLIALGSGATRPGEAHIYMGTSGWVSAVTDRRLVDTEAFIASILGPRRGSYNYISELETAGKCLEWVRDHLALDEIGVYLGKATAIEDEDARFASLYELLSETVGEVEAGSGGLIFTPWLHGNRSPFEDSKARGMFFNIGIGTGKKAMVRAVVEGVGFHFRWQLESIRRKARVGGPLRFVGGGARSPAIAQVFADLLCEVVETVANPENAGAFGAALLVATGLGLLPSNSESSRLVPALARYEPDPTAKAVYDRQFAVFKELYSRNKASFAKLNADHTEPAIE